ncbi:unnamed protein product [Caenorhabditis auriculariae]|uniref:MADF domain-containing protein n=1 Tax=Caenorhabditis auriculariae TaxID=2777116 RepID=A0A8S1HTE6_9PELO|nr:unnamed protein product [Caenorhabditis auriculariae]
MIDVQVNPEPTAHLFAPPPNGEYDPKQIQELEEKIAILQMGLPIDWLVRAKTVSDLETVIHLSQLQERWAYASTKVVAKILQDHERNGGEVIPENDPPESLSRRNSSDGLDSDEMVAFITRLMNLIQVETVIWDKEGDARHGFHRPMRQAWFNISLKLGGWGTIPHVQMLKSIYRRKRDQYNGEYLRGSRPTFQYVEQMSFLSNIVERHTMRDLSKKDISLKEYIQLTAPGYKTLSSLEEMIMKAKKSFSGEKFAEYLTACCNSVLEYREGSALRGLTDEEWKGSSGKKKAKQELNVKSEPEDEDEEDEDEDENEDEEDEEDALINEETDSETSPVSAKNSRKRPRSARLAARVEGHRRSSRMSLDTSSSSVVSLSSFDEPSPKLSCLQDGLFSPNDDIKVSACFSLRCGPPGCMCEEGHVLLTGADAQKGCVRREVCSKLQKIHNTQQKLETPEN